jgi:NAD(P)-dependent dehydrogenase (short-subunit alcohol dehydrogenase family)
MAQHLQAPASPQAGEGRVGGLKRDGTTREDKMRLANKIGIVTAAASGMGRAGALRFAKEGAAVGVADIDQAGVEAVVAEITAAGGRALALVGDLRQDEFARDIVRRTVRTFGGLDFVWNHVGHPGPAAIEGIDMADYELAMDLNLRTVLVTTETAIPELRARGGGALLFTASTSGLVGSQFSPVYSMAKFGIVGFVRSLAKRLAPDNIRANAICPGPIDTPMLRVFVARPDQQQAPGDQDKEALIIRRAQQVPLRRTGKPEEIANAALFLLSDEASFVSGAALPVDGAATA